MDRQAQRDIRRKLKCLQFAQDCRSVVLTCRKFGVARSSFCRWEALFKEKGEAGLINSKPCPKNLPLRTPARIEEKILHLRRTYHFGPDRIAWYLARYHQNKISGKGVYVERGGSHPLVCRESRECPQPLCVVPDSIRHIWLNDWINCARTNSLAIVGSLSIGRRRTLPYPGGGDIPQYCDAHVQRYFRPGLY